MKFDMQPLPWSRDALEPHISARTVTFHFDKHHRGYMSKLEALVAGTPRAHDSLEQLVRNSDGDVFNAAAQVWNHDFYWQSLAPNGGGEPRDPLARALQRDFDSVAGFRDRLKNAATTHFGSGWAWLVVDANGRLDVVSTHDADNPLRHGYAPLLTIDVWEHAYYLDVQNDRAAYVDRVLEHLLNWEFAAQNLERAREGHGPASLRAVQ